MCSGDESSRDVEIEPWVVGQRSSVVEQRFRKPQVESSNLSVGSTKNPIIDAALNFSGPLSF